MVAAPKKQFGKRPPPVEEAPRPAKRSGYVALFLMGTVAVGAGAYAMMPSERCEPTKPPAAGQAVPPGAPAAQNQSCRTSSRSSGYSYGGRSSRSNFFDSSSSSSSHSSSGGLAIPTKSTTSRGGFGSFGHAIASSFSRGG
jgi:hypothetical protein